MKPFLATAPQSNLGDPPGAIHHALRHRIIDSRRRAGDGYPQAV